MRLSVDLALVPTPSRSRPCATDQLAGRQPPTATLVWSRSLEDEVLRRDGNADTVLRDERAQHVTLLSTDREETDQNLSHERARSDQALATRDDFMGIVSHDLLTLLNAIAAAASLIESGAP